MELLFTSEASTALLESLLSSEMLSDGIDKLIGHTTTAALVVAPVLCVLTLGWNYLKSGFDRMATGKPGPPVDIQQLGRAAVIMLFIIAYKPIAGTGNSFIMYVNSITAPTKEQMQKDAELKEKLKEKSETDKKNAVSEAAADAAEKQAAEAAADEKGKDSGILASLANIADTIGGFATRLGAIMISSTATFIGMIIKIMIGGIAACLYKFLLVIGPLAAAFSILPFQSSKLEEWAGTTINAGFVFTTFNILDHMMYIIDYKLMGSPSFSKSWGYSADTVATIMSITTIVLYLCAFWLTGKWVGKGDAGRAAGKLLTLATTAAVAAVSAGAGAAAGAAAGTSGTGGAANAVKAATDAMGRTKDAFTDDE